VKPRRLLGAICAVLATVSIALIGAPTASADEGRDPRAQLMRLRDECDAATWNAEFPNLCAGAGSVTLAKFRADLAKGGSGAWWINNREQTINAGDSLHVINQGGIVHSFTEVSEYGTGIVPEWNTALPAGTPPAATLEPFFLTFVTSSLVDSTAARDVPATQLTTGVHKFQCMIHPWMRTVVTVR
jgi:hypothetical protein